MLVESRLFSSRKDFSAALFSLWAWRTPLRQARVQHTPSNFGPSFLPEHAQAWPIVRSPWLTNPSSAGIRHACAFLATSRMLPKLGPRLAVPGPMLDLLRPSYPSEPWIVGRRDMPLLGPVHGAIAFGFYAGCMLRATPSMPNPLQLINVLFISNNDCRS